MRVRCVSDELSPEQIAATGFPPGLWDVTPGEEYLVLGITVFPPGDDSYMPCGLGFEIEGDGGTVMTFPVQLFEVVDERPSRYWRFRILERCIALWPEEFFEEFFFDDLSEGRVETERIYRRVREALEKEHERDDAPEGL